MYNVSQTYLDKVFSEGSIQRRITGLIDGSISFTDQDILDNTFHANFKAVASNDIKLGGVNVGKMTLTFLKPFADRINRETWKDRTISISIDLKIGANTWEGIPLRPFYISEAVHTLTGIDITAYDAMAKFDKRFSLSSSSGKMYDFLLYACQECGVMLGMTRADVEALPNGTETLTLYANNDIETYRDMLYWLAVTACCYADIDRQGRLVLRTWKTTADININKYHRYSDGTWSDFNTYYTGISVVNMDKETTSYYGMAVDDGLTMNIGSNPFLQYGSDVVKNRQRLAVLTALQNFNYVPFKASGKIDPCFDLGDVIQYTGGVANGAKCCIMAIDLTFRDTTMQGFGKNPALANTRSKEDKVISGLLSKTSENELVTYTFLNVEQYTINEGDELEIINIKFATINPRVVKIFHEINLTATPNGDHDVNVRVRYYLNDELLTYTPFESWYDKGYQAPHILTLMYFLQELEAGQRYDWKVVLDVVGGTVDIPVRCCRAFLEGQGLVASDEWAGEVTVDDPTYYLVLGGNMIFDYADAVTADVSDPATATATDNTYILTLGGDLITSYVEGEVRADTSTVLTGFITESGDALITEDGNRYILENDEGGN